MMKKAISMILILACAPVLFSCRNISAQDFGPDDIVNIIEVILKKDDRAPEAETEPAGTEETEETEKTEEIAKTGESGENPQSEISGNSEESEASAQQTTETATEKTSEEPTKPEETTNPHYEKGEATIINIRDIFPEAPEKFWEIAYPESVPLLDSAKKSIKNLAGFSARDFKGFSFYIATTDSKLFTPFYGGGALSDARRYRTEIVEAECNAQIITLEKPKETMVQNIKLAAQADDFYSDILCVPFDVQSDLILNGLVVNLKKVPFLNINAEHFNASATEAFTVNGNIFGLVSDLTFDPATVYAVFYNRTLAAKYNLAGPLAIYKDGAWNWDAMFSVSKEFAAAAADLDGGRLYSIGLDGESDDVANGLFVTSGNKYFTKRDYSYPIMNYANDKTMTLIQALSEILAPPKESGVENYLNGGKAAQKRAFSSGNMLFSISRLEMLPDITDSKFDWGLLPVPSTDSNYAGRFSFAGSDALCISALQTARNTEACGIMIGALSTASHMMLKDIYVKDQMTFHLRDVDSVGILGEILENITFNQYNAFMTVPEIRDATVRVIRDAASKKRDFSDGYEISKAALNKFFASSPPFLGRG
ncbi:MAG: hypothetical protein FWG34_08435 [Oscillospiraceae bacterium]|nr:hypothetical protein [Oscillospiraceae bacterium]